MMIPAALAAARTLTENGITAAVINVPVIKPLDGATIAAMARRARIVITAENHTIVGGLGSAVAEALAEAGTSAPLRRVGIADTFAEAGSREYLFAKYGLGTQDIIEAAWRGLAINRPTPIAPVIEASPGVYAPV
jgi:transketolase